MDNKKRCSWVDDSLLYKDYHDNEWGVPVYDDRLLFEFLSLEGMQAGLSWLTVLKKRQAYRQLFDYFDIQLIANYDQRKIDSLLENRNIIRNKLKINSIINNAQVSLELTKTIPLRDYFWSFVNGKIITNNWQNHNQVPSETDISIAMSKDLKQRGFKFVGPTICYAFIQAVGMVNDHTIDCFRYHELVSQKDAYLDDFNIKIY